jgi:hypothetical protein
MELQLSSRKILTLSSPNFLLTAYSPALIFLGRERGWWITCNYPRVLKEKKHVETERVQPALSVGESPYYMRKSVEQAPTAGEQTQQKPCRTSSDIGAEHENHIVGRGST